MCVQDDVTSLGGFAHRVWVWRVPVPRVAAHHQHHIKGFLAITQHKLWEALCPSNAMYVKRADAFLFFYILYFFQMCVYSEGFLLHARLQLPPSILQQMLHFFQDGGGKVGWVRNLCVLREVDDTRKVNLHWTWTLNSASLCSLLWWGQCFVASRWSHSISYHYADSSKHYL